MAQVVAPVRGGLALAREALQAAGDRLDRRERIVELVAEHPDQALPGLALLLAQRTAHVGQHEQPVGRAALAERARPDLPPPRPAGERGFPDLRRALLEKRREAELLGAAAEQPRLRLAEQALAGAVDELQPPRSSKANTATSISSMTFDSSAVASRAPSRCSRSVSASALTSSSTSPSGSSGPRPAGADREVLLAQRRQQIGERLQRADDALAQRQREGEPRPDEDRRQRPAELRREVARPQEHERDRHRGQRRQERQEQDPPFVRQRAGGHGVISPCFSSRR